MSKKIKERKERRHYVGAFDIYDWDNKDVDEVISRLQDLKAGKPEALFVYCKDWGDDAYKRSCDELSKYHRFTLTKEGYEDPSIEVHGYRWETDDEMKSRIEKSLKAKKRAAERRKKEKAKKEEAERKTLAKLKVKYEG